MNKKKRTLLMISCWVLIFVGFVPPQRYSGYGSEYEYQITRFTPIIFWSDNHSDGEEIIHSGLDSYSLFIIYLFIITITFMRYKILDLEEEYENKS